MAFYVVLLKTSEDDATVEYDFGEQTPPLFRLRVDRATGNVHNITTAAGVAPEPIFIRAAMKVRQHWAANYFPQRTTWAS